MRGEPPDRVGPGSGPARAHQRGGHARSSDPGCSWQLKLDHDVGSIEAGKPADFTVLEDDPLTVDPVAIEDIGIWGTVVAGTLFPVDAAASHRA